MDHVGVYRIGGSFVRTGYATFCWDSIGRITKKTLYADHSRRHMIYVKDFYWDDQGRLNRWELTSITTGDRIVKHMNWHPDGTLSPTVTHG